MRKIPRNDKYYKHLTPVMAPVRKIAPKGLMNPKIEKAINEQINAEFFSAYLYIAMSSWFDSTGLKGFAHWERIQAMEERDHALKFFDYLCARGGRPVMKAIDAPPSTWKTPDDVFEAQLAHELKVTEMINNLVNLAQGEKDHATVNFLQWFVSEQVEEEENARTVIDQLKLISLEKGAGIFMLDKEMATRVYTPPVQTTT
jgi:ferritin